LPMSMPIDAKDVVVMGCFSGCCGVVIADYPSGGSSRSIPLADLAKSCHRRAMINDQLAPYAYMVDLVGNLLYCLH
jgi:hypothetical protein